MERHLTGRNWLVGEGLSVADIALLAYTRVAHEGGFDLAARPALRDWIARGDKQLNLTLAA
jgi:glutathione S-transferase